MQRCEKSQFRCFKEITLIYITSERFLNIYEKRYCRLDDKLLPIKTTGALHLFYKKYIICKI